MRTKLRLEQRPTKPFMHLNQRITAFAKLGDFLRQFARKTPEPVSELQDLHGYYTQFLDKIQQAKAANAWFTVENQQLSVNNWADALTVENLTQWLANYELPTPNDPKKVAVIMAGNLPLVGFHDFLSVLISGNHLIAKLSSNDKHLLPFLAEVLVFIEPRFRESITFTTERLPEHDAVIATGSNNTARYFEYYFGKKPNIIRKNRNAIAVLNGTETKEQLSNLGNDIFGYFGMGCRSVSKIYVPKGYVFDSFYEAIYDWKELINHHKYANNYDYNKAIYLMSMFNVYDNGFLVLKEDQGMSSPIAVLFYEFYKSEAELLATLHAKTDEIQCVVSDNLAQERIPLGQSQHPKLWNYADGVDTIAFLAKL